MWDHHLEKARMNITLPLRFLKPAKMGLPKTCKLVSKTEKVVIKELEDKQYMFVDSGAIIISDMNVDNDMVLMVWHMINDGVCEVDFGVKTNKNMVDSKIN